MKTFRYPASLFLIVPALFILTSSIAFASSATWTNDTTGSSASDQNWNGIISSSDGMHLAAVEHNPGDIWTSSDGGVTWTNRTTGTSASGLGWRSISSSSNGTHLAAIVTFGDIWTSSDGGATWTNRTTGTSASGQPWNFITSSADGTRLAAVPNTGDIWISTDSGATWSDETTGTLAADLGWRGIAASTDGTHLAAIETDNGDDGDGSIWTSSDGGVTWIDRTMGTDLSGLSWDAVTSSSDGTHVAALENTNGDIWTSSDSGVTWTDRTAGSNASGLNWNFVYSSADGTELVAVESNFGSPVVGDIWISTNSGVAWTNTTAGTSATGFNWCDVTSSSDGTKLAASICGGDIWTGVLAVSPPAPTPVPSNGPPAGLIITGGGAGSVAIVLPNNGGEAVTTTASSTVTLSVATAQLISLYTALLQLLQQELSILMGMRGN